MPGRHSRTLSIDRPSAVRPDDQDGLAREAGVDNRISVAGPSLSPTPPAGPQGPAEAGGGGAVAALESPLDNSSGWSSKWAVLDELRKFTTIPAQRLCMAQTRAEKVTIGRREGRALFGDALPCGKRFCPNCGPRIQASRRDELRDVVAAARGKGWGVYFLTLTLGHSKSDSLADLLDALDSSLRAMLRGGFWNRTKKRHGIRHYVRVTEQQQGGENGWHPHFHLLLFVDPGQARDFSKFALQDALIEEWARIVTAAGYRASRTAQLLLEPTDEHLTRMAAYFSKQMAESLAWEMTSQATKQGKNGSRNPAELLVAACAGDREARAAWRELEDATASRRMIAWSVGIHRDLALPSPDRAEDVAREDPPAPAEQLVAVSRDHWAKHASRAGFREALEAVVVGAQGPEEVVWWLSDRGIPAAIVPERPPHVPAPPDVGPSGAEWLVTL